MEPRTSSGIIYKKSTMKGILASGCNSKILEAERNKKDKHHRNK
jgi:hypothetical protein